MAALAGCAVRRTGRGRKAANNASSPTGSPGTGSAGTGPLTNERWVMLNKDHFQRIFNDTLLEEMTSSAGPASPLPHPDQADLPSLHGGKARLTPLARPSPPVTPTMGLNLVVREIQKAVADQVEDLTEHWKSTQSLSEDVPDSSPSPHLQTESADRAGSSRQKKFASQTVPCSEEAGARGQPQVVTGSGGEGGEKVRAAAAAAAGDKDKVEREKLKASACVEAEEEEVGGGPVRRSRPAPEGPGRQAGQEVKAGLPDGATNTGSAGSPGSSSSRSRSATQPSGPGGRNHGPVCSELLKNRPLVCAALFGEGRRSTHASAGDWAGTAAASDYPSPPPAHVHPPPQLLALPPRDEDTEDELIDPVGRSSSSSSTPLSRFTPTPTQALPHRSTLSPLSPGLTGAEQHRVTTAPTHLPPQSLLQTQEGSRQSVTDDIMTSMDDCGSAPADPGDNRARAARTFMTAGSKQAAGDKKASSPGPSTASRGIKCSTVAAAAGRRGAGGVSGKKRRGGGDLVEQQRHSDSGRGVDDKTAAGTDTATQPQPSKSRIINTQQTRTHSSDISTASASKLTDNLHLQSSTTRETPSPPQQPHIEQPGKAHGLVTLGEQSASRQSKSGVPTKSGGGGRKSMKSRASMMKGSTTAAAALAPLSGSGRENWVTMNKSTLVNLVDVLVGPGLSSSEDEEPPTRHTVSNPSRRSSESLPHSDSSRVRDKFLSDNSGRGLKGRDSRTGHSMAAGGKEYTMSPSSMASAATAAMLTSAASATVVGSAPLRSQLKPTLASRKAPAPPGVASSSPSMVVSGEKGPVTGASKQVLCDKQCWMALNKTVVLDMVELAMGGSPDSRAQHHNKADTEGRYHSDPGDVSASGGGCDGECSENSTDSMCSVHGPHQGDQREPSAPVPAAKSRAVRKRPPDASDLDRFSSSRKRSKRLETRGLSYKPEIRLLAPERPASAPVEASPIHPSLRGPNRAPSPHSKEYDLLRRVHASECERLMSWAKRCARTQASQNNNSNSQSSDSNQSGGSSGRGASGSGQRSSARDSPGLGWVAISKANIQSIMDSFLSVSDPSSEDRSHGDRESESRSPSPSSPPHLIRQVPSPMAPRQGGGGLEESSPPPAPAAMAAQEPLRSAPHRPWLDPEPPAATTATSHSSTSSSHSASSPASSQAYSPPPGAYQDGGASPNSAQGSGAGTAFKWKSRVLLRHNQGSPEHGGGGSDDDVMSRKTPSPPQQPEVTYSPARSDGKKSRRKRRNNKSKQ